MSSSEVRAASDEAAFLSYALLICLIFKVMSYIYIYIYIGSCLALKSDVRTSNGFTVYYVYFMPPIFIIVDIVV